MTRPRSDTDPRLQSHARSGCEIAHGLDQSKAGSYRPLGIILVGGGIPEVGEYTIAQILGDQAVEPVDLSRSASLEVGHHITLHLRIEPGRECAGTDQVAKKDSDLATFGGLVEHGACP
jgi:hypothetical protein